MAIVALNSAYPVVLIPNIIFFPMKSMLAPEQIIFFGIIPLLTVTFKVYLKYKIT